MHAPQLEAPVISIPTITHHAYVLRDVINTRKKRILEIGPGDFVVVDYLRRCGRKVDTLDLTDESKPDFVADIRKPLSLSKRYELIILSEVLEHAPFDLLPERLNNISSLLEPGGLIYFSVPMSTWRPLNWNTNLPVWVGWIVEWPLRLAWRIGKGVPLREAMKLPHLPEFDPNDATPHHWDTGYWRSNRKRTRELLAGRFLIVSERVVSFSNFEGELAANTVHWLIRPRS